METRKLIRPREIVILLIILVATSAFLIYRNFSQKEITGVYAELYVDDAEPVKISLDKPQIITVPNHPEVIIEVKDNHSIGFTHSDCPDQVCVGTGFLSQPGQASACLPNNTLLFMNDDSASTEAGADIAVN